MVRRSAKAPAHRMVGSPHRPPEGDRRLHRQARRCRTALRPALRGQARVRVAGPFTVESLSPHRVVPADEDELLDDRRRRASAAAPSSPRRRPTSPPWCSRTSAPPASSRATRPTRIDFTSLDAWPGEYIAAEGRFMEGETRAPRRHLHRPRVRHALPRRLDRRRARGDPRRASTLLIACAFNFDAHASELDQARPAADPQGQDEPRPAHGRRPQEHRQGQPVRRLRRARHRHPRQPDGGMVEVRGQRRRRVRPQRPAKSAPTTPTASPPGSSTPTTTRKASSSATPTSSARNDPYKTLKTALRAEIDEEAWATLYRDTSRPFPTPDTAGSPSR